MAKDRRKLQHIHSSLVDKQPTAASLEVGEIAVNNAANKEFLSIKNSNDKVVRFSSDSQLIDWVEKKEVMPYQGFVRGATGPSATSGDSPTSTDGMGSYGITNDDLLNNKSEIVIKLNQVVAKNTAKYNLVNGKKDKYNKDINPTTDGGLTNGAGFFIDMSRYAMRGGNPSFSSVTVTHQSNLSGTTNISDGAGGSVLNITTTSVSANDTNWTETITNKTSKVTTLAESATTATLSGNTLDITEATRISAKTPSASVSGTNLSVVETNTDINSCGRISGKTNAYSMEECATGGTHTQKYHTSTISGTNLNVTEGISTINSTNTNLTGTNLTIKESTTTLSSTTTTISGGTLTQTTTGATTVNVGGNLTENVTGTTTINSTGTTTIAVTGSGNDLCLTAADVASFRGAAETRIGKTCANGGQSTTVNINGTTINETGATVNISGSSTANISGGTINVSGGTINEKSPGNITIESSGAQSKIDIKTTGVQGRLNLSTEDYLGIYSGRDIVINIGDTSEGGVYISGDTRISGATTIGGVTTINNNLNVTGNTNITGTTTVKGTLDAQNGLSKKLSWTYGDARNASSGETNFKTDTSFVIPKSVDNLTNYDGTNITLPHPVNVSGTVTATGAIYSSDRNLKENIDFIEREDFNKVKNIFAKSFNFKDDEDKRKVYGVIAQEVQEAGLDELVHVKPDGNLGVDYTSLLILKVAYLEDLYVMLNQRIAELENKVNELESKN